MACSSSSTSGENPYPYPSHVCAPNIVTMKLSGRDTYDVWKTQMLCLLESHDMLSFITHAVNMSDFGKEQVYKLWRRSDALVKGWILGSLSQQPLKFVVKTNTDFTSKDVWDKLQTIYGPPAPPLQDADAADYATCDEEEMTRTEETIKQETEEETRLTEEEKKLRKEEREKRRAARQLYEATLEQDFGYVKVICEKQHVTLREKITINGNTALHVAVATTKNKEFLENMLNWATRDNQQLDMRNSEGSTLLHVAAIIGNTQAAEILVKKNKKLLYAKDKENQTPLARALSNMHTKTYLYLSKFTCVQHLDKKTGASTCYELLVNIISSKDYRSALAFFGSNMNRLLTDIDIVLMAIAQNFPSKLNFWERLFVGATFSFTFSGYNFKFVEATKRKETDYQCAILLLRRLCMFMTTEIDSRSDNYYSNAILEATRQNAYEFVVTIVSYFPEAIWSANEDGHNIIQYAVINRSEKVYNLLYQMSEHKNIYRTIKDSFGNNLLHLAARLAPPDKLKHISGAALQIQHELQWFKEVEGFVCPLNIIQKNWFEETPQMVFTKEHKEMVIDGEKWMKETAQSYTITAALITTIVFAAAITVPGGNKQDNGMPMFTYKTAFTVFAVSDAISLFTSVTSLLMFLSILTARFSEQDFLYKLPTKLIIGLTTLFISTTAMLVAFGATLFLVFGRNNPQILVLVIALTCLPIACFATLQYPLIKDLISSTYGHSIFGKKSSRPFY